MDDRDLTRILQAIGAGDPNAVDRLTPLVYEELRLLARAHLGRERDSHTLQATALVHEAYLRLVDQTRVEWQNRAHFCAVASLAIRRILVDHARRRASEKRGGDRQRLSLTLASRLAASADETDIDLIALDEALAELATTHPDHARLVELRFFGGLTAREAAAVQGVTQRTVERWWRYARAWLFLRLRD